MAPLEPVADLPAGLDPDELAAAPGTSARRGKLRRRIAFLRAARELLLRDLGGFIYELHRTAHDIEHEAHRRLRETKLARLSRVDAELHELEFRLDDVRRQVLVREPGVGGECSHCGELFASSAHYCSNCGNPLTESARRELAKAQAPAAEPEAIVPVVTPPGVAEPQPATADQPTQEIGPLDPNHPSAEPEFQWPSRGIDLRKRSEGEAAAPAEGGDVASGAPVGETGADVAPAPGESRGGETPAAAAPGEDATGEVRGGETPAARPASATARSAAARRPRQRHPARTRPARSAAATPRRRTPARTRPARPRRPRRTCPATTRTRRPPPPANPPATAPTARRTAVPRRRRPVSRRRPRLTILTPRGTAPRLTTRSFAPWSGASEHDGDSSHRSQHRPARSARAALPALREHAGA